MEALELFLTLIREEVPYRTHRECIECTTAQWQLAGSPTEWTQGESADVLGKELFVFVDIAYGSLGALYDGSVYWTVGKCLFVEDKAVILDKECYGVHKHIWQ